MMNKYFLEPRKELLDVEQRIIRITGVKPDGIDLWIYRNYWVQEDLKTLLSVRHELLDDMFIGSEEEMAALKKVNDKLKTVADHVQNKVSKINECRDFDLLDHCFLDVRSQIWVTYSSENCVNPMANDSEYGSRFALMNCILDKYYSALDMDNVDPKCADLKIWDKSDASSWWVSEDKNFDGIQFCYPLIDLAFQKYYSVADVARLNNFVGQVWLCGKDYIITNIR